MTFSNLYKGLLKFVLAAVILLTVMIMLLTGGRFFSKSGISNCVIVDNEKDFTGEWLQHTRASVFERMPTSDCTAKDLQIDSGDGPRRGKVRWAECTHGPDCKEAGMF